MTGLTSSWKKSQRSTSGNCVEVRRTNNGVIQVRDSKNPYGAVLAIASTAWGAFIDDLKADEFNL